MTLVNPTTVFDPQPIASVYADPSSGRGVNLTDPGIYKLSSAEPWFYSETDGLDASAMTAVASDETVTFTVTTAPIVRYIKTKEPYRTSVRILFVQVDNAGGGGGGGDTTQFVQRATERAWDVTGGFASCEFDDELQVPCVAGTYQVEAMVVMADAAHISLIGCNVLTGAANRQTLHGESEPTAGTDWKSWIGNHHVTVRAPGADLSDLNFMSLVGSQKGYIHMIGKLTASGAGIIGVLQTNQVFGTASFEWRGGWLKVTKIA